MRPRISERHVESGVWGRDKDRLPVQLIAYLACFAPRFLNTPKKALVKIAAEKPKKLVKKPLYVEKNGEVAASKFVA